MLKYILHRFLALVPVLVGVSVLVFGMQHLVPGDPVAVMMQETGASAETMARLRSELGLDRPVPEQYWRFLVRAVRGHLGNSIRTGRPVIDEIKEQFPHTVELTLVGMGVAILAGMALGIISALNRNRWLDTVSMVGALAGVSMPNFWLGLMLIFLFSLTLGWFPSVGEGGWKTLVLPALTLGLHAAAIVARMTRSSLLEVLGQDYVRTARAKGLRNRTVVLRHALQNALLPVVTLIGLQFGRMLAGAVVVETVFSRQGIGRLAVRGILSHDFPLVQGTVLLTAVVYVLANLLVDLSYALFDPRIREGMVHGHAG